MSGLVLVAATWLCKISYRNRLVDLSVLHLLLFLNLWRIFEIQPALVFFFRYYSGRCSFELADLATLPHSRGWFIVYSNRLRDFSDTVFELLALKIGRY